MENITFSLPYGAILGFVGENGAGKTTTIGCILNTIIKDSGTIKLFGKEMRDVDTDMKGLLKNNFYAALTNVKTFSIFMLLLGIFSTWDH